MSQIRVIICRVDEENPDQMTELASYDLASVAVEPLDEEGVLDELEASVHKQGNRILRGLMEAQWAEVEQRVAAQYRRSFPP